ncbi:MAG: ECF transporter S component [Anaerostipes sp.]|jgi:uncharacterized membrane protein|nr:ECF transporter S component [Anaerostipes sp.]MDD3746734.1 ECF transporter S component [Anaerostipes sp.]
MKWNTKMLTKTAMMMALVFICTYTFKIPVSLTGGYTHLGDCMIFLSVILLGRKYGVVAGAAGAALSDFTGGFLIWVIPTLLIKGMMAWTMGTFIDRFSLKKKGWMIIGAVIAGLVQITGYTFVKIFIIGTKAALLTIPTISFQTCFGIAAAFIFLKIFEKTNALEMIQNI